MTTLTDHDVFWLARYAHNTLAPLFAEVKSIEPSSKLSIEMAFASAGVRLTDGHVSVYVHWKREGMFLYSPRHSTKADIDQLADQVKDKIAGLKDVQEISTLLESVSI